MGKRSPGLLASILKALQRPSPAPAPKALRRAKAPDAGTRLAHEIHGESHYQEALAEICGGKTADGHLYDCEAELRPEPDNPHDPNAVAVFIRGHRVGYLPRQTAKRYGKAFGGASVTCPAKIVGGWRRREGRSWDEGSFGVELDLYAP